ncbi:hypothetical protein J5N97_009142 [Dioscorea zingiberensis]|uniref:Uncharacterized protein n=1 Tax=Dioscorea zingiberensis TaxID=325984 RepID=A0A9D5CXM8_9LILI|nr:hypothetical protein J5N97_009142 [Dioscorea zingiberensis]
MAEWGRGSSRRSYRGSTRPPKYSRPPSHHGSQDANIPFWEKKFLTSVCSMAWSQLSYAKDSLYLYKNIQEWNDSAGLEAFQNAKSRYWAKINNLPCDVPLPDPDMYIDEVDYDVVIDPELVADLYKEPELPLDESGSDGSFIPMNLPITPTGWGDAEDQVPTTGFTSLHQSANSDVPIVNKIIPTGWGDAEDQVPTTGLTALHQSANSDVPIENKITPTGWGDAENDSGWDVSGKSSNAWTSGSWDVPGDTGSKWNTGDGWGDAFVKNSIWQNERCNFWNNEVSRKYGGNKDGGSFGLRKTTSRFKPDHHPTNNNWRNYRGKQNRIDHNEQTVYAGRPTTQQWKPINSCGPVNNQASDDKGAAWQWKRSIS